MGRRATAAPSLCVEGRQEARTEAIGRPYWVAEEPADAWAANRTPGNGIPRATLAQVTRWLEVGRWDHIAMGPA
jgi:hypothetical protein